MPNLSPVSLIGAKASGSPTGKAAPLSQREKAAIVSLRFESGGTVGLSLGGLGARANAAYPWLELFTENGWLAAGGENHVWKRVAWSRRGETVSSQLEADPEQLGRTRYTDAFEHFVDCVRSDRKPDASVADGVLMVQIADAVRESFTTGKPVSIAESHV